MKTQKAATALILSLIAIAAFLAFAPQEQQEKFSEKAFFCPEDDCARELVKEITASKKSIHAAVYSFTSAEIAGALVQAQKRGVEVKIITDALQAESKYSKDEFLQQNAIEVRIKKIDGGSMHNKFMIIDGTLVAAGSFNYTENADTRNDENLILFSNQEIATEYESEFSEIWQQAS